MSEPLVQASSREGNAPVEVVAYDDSWPSRFEAERLLLEAVLAPWLAGSIEHIGSTAVPLLPAKPVIDIMAPVHAELKLRLAETFRLDREAYTEAKAPFVQRVLSELNAHC